MKKILLISCLIILFAFVPQLSATAQIPEILILNGQKEAMFCAPLEEYFKKGHSKPKIFEGILNSALWRGYVGTWKIENDELFLIALGNYNEEMEFNEAEYNSEIKIIFSGKEPPIKATWFSGVISIPRGEMLRYVHMGFGSTYSKVLYLTIKEGNVIGKREIDNTEYGATRSDADMQWVALAQTPINDDGKWTDARLISVKEMKNQKIITRGIFFPGKNEEYTFLWIPETPTTPQVEIELFLESKTEIPSGSHIEITGYYDAEIKKIKAISLRQLNPGESIHHPDFISPKRSKSKVLNR